MLLEGGGIERDVDVLIVLGRHGTPLLQANPVQADLVIFSPLVESVPSAIVVIGLGDNSQNEFFAGFRSFSACPECVSPIAIGGLAVGVDLDSAGKPFAGTAIDVLLEID